MPGANERGEHALDLCLLLFQGRPRLRDRRHFPMPRAPTSDTSPQHADSAQRHDPACPMRPVNRLTHPVMGLIVDRECQLKGSHQREKETDNEAQKSARSAPGSARGTPWRPRIGRIRCHVHHAPILAQALSVVRYSHVHLNRKRGERLSPLAPRLPADHSEGVVFWMSMRNSALDWVSLSLSRTSSRPCC